MNTTLFNMLITMLVVGGASWISGKSPGLAGFLVAMPISTLLVLPMSQARYMDADNSIRFAQMIFAAIPVSLLFFVPFLLAGRLQLGFWGCYSSGCVLLIVGYFVHRALAG